ncbi:serine--tRNA ligase, partial [Acinetobacter baumannii]
AFDAGLAKRGLEPQAAELVALDEKRRALITEVQAGLARRNEASKAIGAAKAAKDDATAAALMAEVAGLKERLPALEAEEKEAGEALEARLASLPNLPYDDVPQGADEDDNALMATVGEPTALAFAAKEHDAIGP